MASDKLRVEQNGGILVLTFNRPDKSNALDDELTAALLDALRQAERDAAVRCVVLTGAGKNFCAGQDLGAFLERQNAPGGISVREHLQKGYNHVVSRIRATEKPFVAAVNGAAAGAGLGIACACDLRIASEAAKFRMAFIGIGLAPDSGTSFLLPRLIGLGRATQMAFTNEAVDAPTALGWGLVNRVCVPEELMAKTMELANALAAAPTRGIGLTKRALNRAFEGNLANALDYEAHLQDIAAGTADHREGLEAFLARRAPNYQGR